MDALQINDGIKKVQSDKGFTNITQAITRAEEKIIALVIEDPKTEAEGSDFIKRLRDTKKIIQTRRDDFTGGAKRFIKEVNALFMPAENKIDQLDGIVRGKLTAYATKQAEEERKRREEEDRKRREEEERKALETATNRDDDPFSEEGETMPDPLASTSSAPLPAAAPEKKEPTKTGTSSLSYKTVLKARLADISKVPADYLIFDQAKADKAVRLGITIPGVEVEEIKTPIVR